MEDEKQFRKRLAAAENLAIRSRKYRRARERALTALARKHKEDYLELLEQEKAKDEQEGKRWHNLAGSDFNSRLVSTNGTTDTDRRDTSDIPQDKGDNE